MSEVFDSRVKLAKETGWRIECLGDQQDGLWNWVLWSPDNGYSIQTEYPLANDGEAWDYFYGFIVGLPATTPAETGAGDSGYTELLDELSGRIKGLERELTATRARLAAAEGERDRLREALESSVRALVRAKPQIKGVLVMQDFEWAIDGAHKALQASGGADGEG